MDSKFYHDAEPFTIYALVHQTEGYFYVGKAKSKFSHIYSRHINAGCVCTRYTFTKDEEDLPIIHLLEIGTMMSPAEAYKHIIAWAHLFIQHGYFCLNADAVDNQARSPLPDTQQIISSFSTEPFEEILKRTKVETPRDADRLIAKILPPVTPEATANPVVQMNVRMQEQDKRQFDALRKELKLSQRETMSLLLAQACQKDIVSQTKGLISSYQKKIKKLEHEFHKLQQKQQILIGKQLSNPEAKKEQLLSLFRVGSKEYLKHQFPSLLHGEICKPGRYKKYVQQLPAGVTYKYPAELGYAEIVVQSIVWGKARSHPCFIFGMTPNGEHIKLRHYQTHLGVPIKDTSHTKPGARWFVFYVPAKDGATDIVGALPLEVPPLMHQVKPAPIEEAAQKSTVPFELLVTDANKRARQK